MLAAGLSSLIVAYVIALVALRTTYHSFGLITLAFTSIISLIYKNWVEITRGPMGIPGVPQPYFELFFFRIDVSTYLQYYYLTLLIIVLSLLFLRKVIRSRIGRALVAIRENPVLAESVGINSKKYMVLAFVLGGFFAGLSGSLYVHFVRFINPDAFAMALTVTALTMTIIGGLGGFNGVVFTAFILFIVPEILRFSPEWRELLFGVFLLACVYLLPEGVEGYFKSILRSSRKKVS
jgi:branched-chain amino acid transport system permease protein